VADSLAALELMEEALSATLPHDPDAEFPALARAATEELVRAAHWPVAPDPLTGLPPNAAPTLYRLWRELDGG